jgi:hypothetical protein
MSLRRKLTIGLVFLFLIIFSLAIYSSFNIQRLSKDAEAILKDNYDSLVYCKNMLLALDDMTTAVLRRVIGGRAGQTPSYDMKLFETGKSTFEANLAKERNNITEIHEADYVSQLGEDYQLLLGLSLQIDGAASSSSSYLKDFLSSYMDARQTIARIDDLNMEAIQRKNTLAGNNARRMIVSIAGVGTACIIIAFFYFWYFPFYVSNSLSFLAGKMNELLKKLGLGLEIQTNDEMFALLNSINLLEKKLVSAAETSKKKRR